MMFLLLFLVFFVPFFVYGVTNSSVSSVNKDLCHYCNVHLTCLYTDLGNAVKSLESKESLIKQNNKSFRIGNAVKSLQAKVGMKVGNQTNFITVNKQASSLSLLMDFIAPPRWVVIVGKHCLGLRPLYSVSATGRVLTPVVIARQ